MKDYTIIYKNGNRANLKAFYATWNGTNWQFATNNGITLLSGDHIETIVESNIL